MCQNLDLSAEKYVSMFVYILTPLFPGRSRMSHRIFLINTMVPIVESSLAWYNKPYSI